MYSIKEIYYTLQGEGALTGRAAVFLRFTGCNLWSGREADRAAAICNFCDTDFVGTDGPGGGKYATAEEVARVVASQWLAKDGNVAELARVPSNPRILANSATHPNSHEFGYEDGPMVVCTGGEPLLQLDERLIDALHEQGFFLAIETNGTLPMPSGIDWVCVSPKAGTELVVTRGDELKLVYPQPGVDPASYQSLDFRHFFLQPMDGPNLPENQRLAAQYCLAHPPWRMSLQTHKILGIR